MKITALKGSILGGIQQRVIRDLTEGGFKVGLLIVMETTLNLTFKKKLLLKRSSD